MLPEREEPHLVIDLSKNPRVTQLLGRIEETRRTADKLPESSEQRRTLQPSVEADYLEVGRYVHWLMRQAPDALARIEHESRAWAAEVDARLARGEAPPPASDAPGDDDLPELDLADLDLPDVPSQDDGSLVEIATGSQGGGAIDRRDLTDPFIPVAEEPTAPSAEEAPTDPSIRSAPSRRRADPEPVELSVDDLEVVAVSDAGAEVLDELPEVEVEPLAMGADEDEEEATDPGSSEGDDEADWMVGLAEIVEVMGPPQDGPMDDRACALAASRIMNATTNMEVRWMGFPDAVQHALLGLIASRARMLQLRMPVDTEMRLTISRLRRFHSRRRLPPLPALAEDGRPELGSWDADARRWHAVLTTGG